MANPNADPAKARIAKRAKGKPGDLKAVTAKLWRALETPETVLGPSCACAGTVLLDSCGITTYLSDFFILRLRNKFRKRSSTASHPTARSLHECWSITHERMTGQAVG